MQHAIVTSRAAATYFEEIRRFPMLKADEEHMLAERWHQCGDSSAAHQLLNSHLRLVAKIAIGYRRYGLPISDLISEGNIGLMQAIKRFDPDKGTRFSTYATWWIKAAIQNHILRSWSLVKMGTTANQKKLFFNLRKAKRRLSATEEGDLRPDQVTRIAHELDVAEQDVVEMNRRLSGDLSLNVPLNDESDSVEWQDKLVEQGPTRKRFSPTVRRRKPVEGRLAWRLRFSMTALVTYSKRAGSWSRRSPSTSSQPSFASPGSGSGRSR